MGQRERANHRGRFIGAWATMVAAALAALVLMGWLGMWLQVSRRVQVRWADNRSPDGAAVIAVTNRGSFAITPESMALTYVRDGAVAEVHRVRFRENASVPAQGQDRVRIPPLPSVSATDEPVALPSGPENRRLILGVLKYRSVWGEGAAHFCLTPR